MIYHILNFAKHLVVVTLYVVNYDLISWQIILDHINIIKH